MSFMTQTKLSYTLNKKANRIEFYIGFILSVIGIIWIFEIHYTNLAYVESLRFVSDVRLMYIVNHNNYDIMQGLWIMPLCLGLTLFLDSLGLIPDIEIIKSIKKYIKKKKEI